MDYPIHTHTYKRGARYAIGLDVILPPHVAGPMPVAMYIHGGALIWGNRGSSSGSKQALISAILGAGMAYASIDYRLAPETNLPEILGDVCDALRWMREEGAAIHGFDPDRVAAIGASAGGYLALCSGTFANPPSAIVSLYGYGDILGD